MEAPVWPSTATASTCWLKRPFLGWGLGTFPIVYPQFRSFYTTFFVNQAHNDYLQLLVETGLAGFAIAIWFLVLMFRQADHEAERLDRKPVPAL